VACASCCGAAQADRASMTRARAARNMRGSLPRTMRSPIRCLPPCAPVSDGSTTISIAPPPPRSRPTRWPPPASTL